MYASIDIYTDDVYTLHTERHAARADVIVDAANMLDILPYATVMRVTLVTPHPDGFHVRDDLTGDVLAFLAWKADVRARYPETVGA
jgi:hypothetical protein